ncbi:MAG: ATP-binding protein, partial [Chloroflexota bacterium]
RVEVVQFGDDAGGDLMEEKVFRGPLDEQIRQALDYLNGLSTTMVRKVPGQAEALRTVAFPYEAMEEALVNAVYHRSYESDEPVKVYLYPNRIEIISYPGPVPGISQHHFERPGAIPPVPSRNRRIGEFLKELRLAEGRGTGIPKIHRKMRENGSPAPGFDFNDERTYFRVTLPAHPQYVAIQALRESAHLWAIGEKQRAIANLESALGSYPSSNEVVSQLIEYKTTLGDLAGAEAIFRNVVDKYDAVDRRLYITMAKAYLDVQSDENILKAREILSNVPSPNQVSDTVELAILYKRANRLEAAHRIFTNNFDLIKNDPKAIHEYAQIKMKLAGESRDRDTRRRLNREAVELLRRTIQLSDDAVRSAWSWYDLARSLRWLNAPKVEIEQAITRAMQLLPDEKRFAEWYRWWRRGNGSAASR